MMKFALLLLVPHLVFAIPTKTEQFQNSLSAVIRNSTMADVRPGMVVASPSKENPNYYYDWVRDTSLTMRALVDYYELKKDARIKQMIFTWIESEKSRQNMPSLTNLGEPKYNVDGSSFAGPWGRPQNDGPALRATAMIKFARLLLSEGNADFVLKNLYHGVLPADSVIKKDLEYTAYHWKQPSFDLWEEEQGMHFYTLLAQHTALQEGAKLARELSDEGAATFYEKVSFDIAHELQGFKDDAIGIRVTTTKTASLGYKHSGIDVAPLLALIHNYPFQKIFSFHDRSVKKYISTLIDSFKDLYPINHAYPKLGVAIGRYPEDKYDGYTTSSAGNPWFLSTLALAEYYCLAKENGAGSQIDRVLFHSDRKGGLSEQFNKDTGYMQGAVDLTWSHNAFMTAMMRCGFLN